MGSSHVRKRGKPHFSFRLDLLSRQQHQCLSNYITIFKDIAGVSHCDLRASRYWMDVCLRSKREVFTFLHFIYQRYILFYVLMTWYAFKENPMARQTHETKWKKFSKVREREKLSTVNLSLRAELRYTAMIVSILLTEGRRERCVYTLIFMIIFMLFYFTVVGLGLGLCVKCWLRWIMSTNFFQNRWMIARLTD